MISGSSDKYTLFFDGGNRGKIGAGAAVLYRGDEEIAGCAEFFTGHDITNNIAEYRGLCAGLELALDQGLTELVVYGDSELVVRQITGQYRTLKPHLIELRDRCLKLASRFERISFHETLPGAKGKRRDNNARADQLANDCMNRQGAILYYEGIADDFE